MRTACIQIAWCGAALLLICGASAATTLKRFSGTIDYEGPGVNPAGYDQFHRFEVRTRLGVTFLDEAGTHTRYRFCWRERGGDAARCWRRQTGLTETRSIVFADAPRRTGSYLGIWYVSGRPVAEWRFRVVAAHH